MLTITINSVEMYDEVSKEFISSDETILQLEHSLVSLSKWESKWEKPFLGNEEKTNEQTLDYIKAMTISGDVSPEVYDHISSKNFKEISEYIDSKMSATWFNDKQTTGAGSSKKEVITSEIIYYWMISLNIPFECQYWHLNRLLTLIKVCNQKNTPEKKMSKQELIARNRALNEQRKAQLNSQG